jgi:myo-inositol-1(or 4)-monophosphatase
MIDIDHAARVAEQAAYAVGTHLLASRARLAETLVTGRDPAQVVAQIAREGADLVRGIVARNFPEHGFCAATDSPVFPHRHAQWFADPLDGQSNYLRGGAPYAVTLALVVDGEPHLGVVYDPQRNEFFGALRGRGAVLNGAPIRCDSPRPAQDAVVATVMPRSTHPGMAACIAEVGRVAQRFGSVRRSVSRALEMAHLAAGRIDAFWGHDLDRRNAAAGIVLLCESGARVESRDAAPLLLSRSMFACTPRLHGSFAALLGAA